MYVRVSSVYAHFVIVKRFDGSVKWLSNWKVVILSIHQSDG